MVRLLNSQGMENCKSREWFCRSKFAIYTNDWSAFLYVFCCYVFFFFCGKFLNVCMPRTTTYPLWQPGPAGLTFYGIGLALLTKLGGDGKCRLALLHGIRNFLSNEIYYFSRLPTKLPFHLGSLLHIISFLFCHFRSWDYPEHFGIYSQLGRKIKTWFFIFLDVYVFWIKQDKILILHSLYLQNSGILQTTMDQRVTW